MKHNDEYFTTKQAAHLLNISIRTAQLWADSGQLNCWVSPGGHRRIEKESVMSLLSTRTEGSSSKLISEHRKSILIVEDDSDLLLLYRLNFKKWNFPIDVRYANDGFVSLVEIGKKQPDLLITDLYMPNMDGFQMLKSLDLADMHLATIVITGATKKEIDKLQEEDEDLLILSKPVDFNLLRRLISTTLDLRKNNTTE